VPQLEVSVQTYFEESTNQEGGEYEFIFALIGL
jgi:hypothetical protein